MRFTSLGSGSSGNATLVEASQGITTTLVLIDSGFSLRELTRRMERAGTQPGELAAVFVTHEHGDHATGVLTLARKHRVPIVTSRGTWRAMGDADFDPALLRFVSDGDTVEVGDLCLQPFSVPHDANEPLQLTLTDGLRHFGVLTDIGSIAPRPLAALRGLDALLLECNHDEAMLRSGSYPESLKRRILGTHGHLSNATAAELLAQVQHAGLHTVVAAHLSERNNSPALATTALAPVRGCAAAEIGVADPQEGFGWSEI
ncbi:MBL fold metallo-hydrolase [Burkholderiaceae bacterium UC74_6]